MKRPQKQQGRWWPGFTRQAERGGGNARSRYRPLLEALEDRLTPSGDFAFALNFGSTGSDEGKAVTTDSAGDVYVAGVFSGTVDFDPTATTASLTSAGNTDVFVAKYSFTGGLLWARNLGGTGLDQGGGIVVDNGGNVYTTGFFSGTADFDPGAGTQNLTSAGDWDVFVSKLDANGNFLWAKRFGGSGTEQGFGVALDASGNVYTTGEFSGTADFDPGAGTQNLTSAGEGDVFVSKLDAAGNFLWAKAMGGTNFDSAKAVAVDGAGNVYTTGYFVGTADFDPGPATQNRTSAGGREVFVSKLDPAGNFLWAKAMGGSSTDTGQGVAVDGAGNVYATGQFLGTADFDPGAGTFYLTSAGSEDIFVSKLDAAGNFLWAKAIGATGADDANSVAVDSAGNVYTTGAFRDTVDFDPGAGTSNLTSAGSSFDVFLSKLDPAGNFLWAKAMGGSSIDTGQGVAVDGAGNVYTTGFFQGTADFDPGPGTQNRTSAGSSDIFLARLTGDRVHRSDSEMVLALTGQSSEGAGVATDDAGNIYVTGTFSGTVDFDPGAGITSLSSTAGNGDVFVAKYAFNGALLWAKAIGGINTEEPRGIAVDSEGNVYTTGAFLGMADFDPGPGTFNLSSAGLQDIFVSKLDGAGNFLWAKAMGGSDPDSASAIAVDATGNIYTTGFFQGTADFDPGIAIISLTSAGGADIFVSKLDTNGNFLWVRAMGSTSFNDQGFGIALDSAGHVYATGCFTGTVDFDPSAGSFNLTSAGNRDVFVSKLDSAGNLVWAKAMGGSSADEGRGIAVDGAGNVSITGAFSTTVDFDPSTDIFNLTSTGGFDAFVSKLDTAGNFLWAKAMGGASTDGAQGVALDGAGNVYTIGAFRGTVDFDSGSGTLNLISAGLDDIFLSKLDAAGNFLSTRRMGGSGNDRGLGLAVDSAGHVYTTGSFRGMAEVGSTRFSTTEDSGALFVHKLENRGPFPFLTPRPETTDTTPTFAWNAVAAAVRYELWVDNRSTGQSQVIIKTDLASPFFTPGTPLPLGNYTAWWRPVLAENQLGPWSAGRNFTVTGFLTPVLHSPPAETSDTTPTIAWQADPQALRFELWVDNVSTGQSKVIHRTDLTSSIFTPASALPLGQYRVWVRAFTASDQASAWSLAHNFRIALVPTPTLTAPAATILETQPLLAWTAVAEANRYELWVDNVTTGQSKVIFQTHLAAPSFTPGARLPAGTYRAWVRAAGAGSTASDWSVARDFTVQPPAAPVLSAPARVTTSNTPTFGWNAVAGAVKYELWVDNITTGESKVIYQTGLAATSFTAASALPPGTYTAWVRALNNANSAAPWSQAYSFQIVTLTFSAPPTETVSRRPTLVWNAVADATRYELWVDNVGTGQSQVIFRTDLAATSFAPASDLPLGQYRAWVRSVSAAGQASPWSPAYDFRIVAMLTPTVYTPTGPTFTTRPVFTWSAIPQATRYDLWVNNVSTGQNEVIRKPDLTGSSFTPATALGAGTYRFWVRALDAVGASSDWSQPLTFTILA